LVLALVLGLALGLALVLNKIEVLSTRFFQGAPARTQARQN
jgi:hypothetical protein